MIFRRGWRGAPAPVAGVLATLFVAGLAVATGAPATGVPHRNAPAVEDRLPDLRVTLTDVSPAVLTQTGTLRVAGTASNDGRSAVRDLFVRLRVNTQERLTTRDDVLVWSRLSAGDAPGQVMADAELGTLRPGDSSPFALEVPATELRLPSDGASFGPYGVAVELASADLPAGDLGRGGTLSPAVAVANTSVVWRPIKEYRPTSLSVILPIVRADATTHAGLIDPVLAPEFAAQGRLSRLLRAAADPRIAWSVDTALLDAADTAVVASAPTDAPTPADPDQADPDQADPDQADPEQAGPTPSATEATTSTRSPTPSQSSGTPTGSTTGSTTSTTAGTGTTPSTTAEERRESPDARAWVQAFRSGADTRELYLQPWGDPDIAAMSEATDTALLERADSQGHDVARRVLGRPGQFAVSVPAAGGITSRTATLLERTGRTAVVVRDSDRAVTDEPFYTLSAGFRIGPEKSGLLGLAFDTRLSDALEQSGRAGNPDQAVARQRVLAELATVTLQLPGTSRHLLAVLPRTWDADPAAFAATVAALGEADWVNLTAMPELINRPVDEGIDAKLKPSRQTTRTPASTPLPSGHVAITSHEFSQLRSFAPALADPSPVVEPLSARAVSIVSSAWREHTAEQLAAARAPLTATTRAMSGGLRVVPGGPYNVWANSGSLPLTVTNELPYPVKAVLRVVPRYGLIRMKESVPLELDPEARDVRVSVPFRGIANGNVPVDTWIETVDGDQVSATTTLEVRVRRNWESRGMIAAVSALLLLLVLGLARSMRRGPRRRYRPDEPVPDVDQLLAARERLVRDHEDGARREVPAARHLAGAAAGGAAGGAAGSWFTPANDLPIPDPYGDDADRDIDRDTDRDTDEGGNGPDRGDGTPSRDDHPAGRPHRHDERDEIDLPESVSGGEALMRSSLVMAAGTASSRLLGFARSAVLAAAIGTATLSADAFSTANKVPNIIYILIAGGVLNAVLVPQITRAARQREQGRIYVDRLLSVALVALVVAATLVTLAAPVLMTMYSGNEVTRAQLQLATVFAYWCLPQVFFYGLYTLLGQVLNARGHFGAYMWAPVVNNLVAIAGLIAFMVIAGDPLNVRGDPAATAGWWTPGRVALLAGTATLGVVAQALVLLPVLRRSGFSWRFRWGLRGSGLGGASRIALWTFGAVLLAQLAYVVTSRVVTDAGHASRAMYGGSPAIDQVSSGAANYDYAFLLFMLPHSLVAVSLVTALFTRLSHSAGAGRTEAVREDLSLGLRITGTATAGASAALLACAPLFTTLMGWNIGVAYGAMAMALGLMAFSAQYLLQRVFYAYEDARTPFMIQLPVAGVTVAGALLCSRLIDPRWVLVGIGLTMTLGSLLAVAISLVVLRRRLGGLDGARVLGVYARLAFAAAVAGGTGWVAGRLVVSGLRELGTLPAGEGLSGVGTVPAGLALAVSGVVVLLLYGVLLRVLRVEELGFVVRPVAGALRRLGVLPRG